jgi:glutamyl-tRNA reductase
MLMSLKYYTSRYTPVMAKNWDLSKKEPKKAKTIEELSYAIVEGILATPMNNLRKEIEQSNENEELKRVVSKLFKYEDRY